MKIKLICLLTLIISNFYSPLFAQEDKTVTITVSGQGKTQDEAKENALRNAIEQAFGTFISTKTELLNDEIISDQITSLSSGNIISYEIINNLKLNGFDDWRLPTMEESKKLFGNIYTTPRLSVGDSFRTLYSNDGIVVELLYEYQGRFEHWGNYHDKVIVMPFRVQLK